MAIGDPRPRAASAMMGLMGCISSTSPRGAPILIANTGLGYRVWLKDGLEGRTPSGTVFCPPATGLTSRPDIDSTIHAYMGGIYGV
jgi:hypothetical protein